MALNLFEFREATKDLPPDTELLAVAEDEFRVIEGITLDRDLGTILLQMDEG